MTLCHVVLQKVGVEVPYPGIDHTQYTGPYPPPKSLIRQHKYYQWVSFFLFFQVCISIARACKSFQHFFSSSSDTRDGGGGGGGGGGSRERVGARGAAEAVRLSLSLSLCRSARRATPSSVSYIIDLYAATRNTLLVK